MHKKKVNIIYNLDYFDSTVTSNLNNLPILVLVIGCPMPKII